MHKHTDGRTWKVIRVRGFVISAGSVALGLGHHAGLVLPEVLDEARDHGVGYARGHLVGGH